ncbi:AraC family transcriptional regulator [Pseudonocardia sp. C8]|uniref:AraC family transcriptional regulator n=1 Tax=Pseudonocardia sp. C8 TaxID=2762759 RepID=UPI001642E5C3|nr:AraC family transcriptional regulator [Pseudonocardia sp. C8]
MSGYRERAPAGPLRDLVEVAWEGRSGPEGARRVLPDGCMDLIVLDGRLVVAGPDTGVHLATTAPGAVTTGLRFRPGALPALLGVPAAQLRDRRVPLADVLDAARLRTALRTGADPSVPQGPPGDDLAQLVRVTAVLRSHDEGDGRRPLPDPLPRPALRALAGGMPAAELADRLGVTARTLHRRCVATLGYGPSVARRVLRFRAAGALLWDGVAPAEVAARCGYADQPHLSREVRALAGVSPATLAAR